MFLGKTKDRTSVETRKNSFLYNNIKMESKDAALHRINYSDHTTENSTQLHNGKIQLTSEEINALFHEPSFQDLNLDILKTSHLLSLEKFQFLFQNFISWNNYRKIKGTEWSNKQLGHYVTKIFDKIQRINNLPFEKASMEIQKIYSTFKIDVVFKKPKSDYTMPRKKNSEGASVAEDIYLERCQERVRQSEKFESRKFSYSVTEKYSKPTYSHPKIDEIEKTAFIRETTKKKARMVEDGIKNRQYLCLNPLKLKRGVSNYKINELKNESTPEKQESWINSPQQTRKPIANKSRLRLSPLQPVRDYGNTKNDNSPMCMKKKC